MAPYLEATPHERPANRRAGLQLSWRCTTISHQSMSSSVPAPRTTPHTPLWPTAGVGWFALAAALVGLGSWVVLPIITSVFGKTYPVTDSFVMPVIGLVLVVAAAVVNVLTLRLARQRSITNIIAALLTVAATLFFGFFVIGEGLGGA